MPRRKSDTRKQQLRGKELLAKVKTLKALNKTEKARVCGYVTSSSNGKERVQIGEFMNALIEAQGIQLNGQTSENRGRALAYRASVQKNGSIVIGAGYTKEMGLNPGECFEIKLGRKSLKLTALESNESDTQEFEDFAHEDEEFDDDEIH